MQESQLKQRRVPRAFPSRWPLGVSLLLWLLLASYTWYLHITLRTLSAKSSHLFASSEISGSRTSLGLYTRIFHAPQKSTPDPGLNFSLYDEAQYLVGASPYLRVSSDGTNIDLYGVSMYHQLHCLEAIRSSVTGLRSSHVHGGDGDGEIAHQADHLLHCIDYISQVSCFSPSYSIFVDHPLTKVPGYSLRSRRHDRTAKQSQ